MTPSEGAESEVPGITPRGGVEALRPFIGRWVVLDAAGEIKASGETFRSAVEAAQGQKIDDPEFLYVPELPFVG
jgi:hypothetical protein